MSGLFGKVCAIIASLVLTSTASWAAIEGTPPMSSLASGTLTPTQQVASFFNGEIKSMSMTGNWALQFAVTHKIDPKLVSVHIQVQEQAAQPGEGLVLDRDLSPNAIRWAVSPSELQGTVNMALLGLSESKLASHPVVVTVTLSPRKTDRRKSPSLLQDRFLKRSIFLTPKS